MSVVEEINPLRALMNKSVGPILLPVIHLFDAEQAVRNARIAFDSGCHGVWLIAHGSNEHVKQNDLLKVCYDAVRANWPTAWIGVNVLSMMFHPEELWTWIAKNVPTVNGVWTDQCFATKSGTTDHLIRIAHARARAGCTNLVYFGGFAFKHQPLLVDSQEDESLTESDSLKLAQLAVVASKHVDVLVTSGTATGATPRVAKVKCIQDAICPAPLALSGAGLNLDLFAKYSEIFFAATALQADCSRHGQIDGCVESFCNFSPERMAQWVALAESIATARRLEAAEAQQTKEKE
jgi:uncharacterized protein